MTFPCSLTRRDFLARSGLGFGGLGHSWWWAEVRGRHWAGEDAGHDPSFPAGHVHPARLWCDIIEPRDCEVLATYAKEFYAGRPAITMNAEPLPPPLALSFGLVRVFPELLASLQPLARRGLCGSLYLAGSVLAENG